MKKLFKPCFSKKTEWNLKAALILVLIIGLPTQGSPAKSLEQSKPFQAKTIVVETDDEINDWILNYAEGKTIQTPESINVQSNVSYRIPAIVIGYQEKAGQKIDLKAYYTLIAPDGKKLLNRKFFSQARSKLPLTNDLIKLNPHLVLSFDTDPPGKYKVEIEIKEGKKTSRAAVYLILSDEIRENMPQTLTAKEWFDKGMELSSSNDYKGAIEAFTKAIRLDQTYTLAYHKRGLRYMTIGKDLRAISDLMAAAQLGHKDSQEYLKIINLKY